MNCPDIGGEVQILGGDPHGFDGDGDGWGCETYGSGYYYDDPYEDPYYDPYYEEPYTEDPYYSGGDLDCSDIGAEVWVGNNDPNGLDGDGDGWGCESYGY